MGWTNTTFGACTPSDFTGMGVCNNQFTDFHGYGLFGISILIIVWFFVFISLSKQTSKAFLAASTVAAVVAYGLWIIDWINADVILIPTIMTLFGLAYAWMTGD